MSSQTWAKTWTWDKTWAYELNANFKNKSELTLCHFMNSKLNKQVQAPKVTFSRKTKSYNSQTCFNNILRIYLNEKLNFYHHIIEKNAQIHIRSENLFFFLFCFFNWDSLHVRLNSHYEAWSYTHTHKKKSTKKITGYRKSV